MNVSLHARRPTFRVSLLQPLSFGRARVVQSWLTDGRGAIDALEMPRESSYAIQVEMEDWEATVPAWAVRTFPNPQPTLQ